MAMIATLELDHLFALSVSPHQADHAHACCRAHVVARHNALRDLWQGFYRQSGAYALTEQSVPELGFGADVVADIRAEEGPTAPVRYADVVVTLTIYSIKVRLHQDDLLLLFFARLFSGLWLSFFACRLHQFAPLALEEVLVSLFEDELPGLACDFCLLQEPSWQQQQKFSSPR